MKKHKKTKGKRPKATVSSHNACRFGYPFFLSPSDDDAMLEIPNPTPSVHQTPGCSYSCCFFLVLCWPKRKETRLSKIPQQNKNSKTSGKLTCTFSPNHQKSKNIKITTPNLSKINQNHPKIIKIIKNPLKSIKMNEKLKKSQKKHKDKGKTT